MRMIHCFPEVIFRVCQRCHLLRYDACCLASNMLQHLVSNIMGVPSVISWGILYGTPMKQEPPLKFLLPSSRCWLLKIQKHNCHNSVTPPRHSTPLRCSHVPGGNQKKLIGKGHRLWALRRFWNLGITDSHDRQIPMWICRSFFNARHENPKSWTGWTYLQLKKWFFPQWS